MQRFIPGALLALTLALLTMCTPAGAAEPHPSPTPETENNLSGYKHPDTGEWQISPRFKSALHFQDGYAIAQSTDTNGWGVIDPTGEWFVEPYLTGLDHGYPSFFQGTLWHSENDEEMRSCPVVFRIRNAEAQWVVECDSYDKISSFRGNSGESDPVDGLGHSQMAAVEKDGKWGYIDRAGKRVIELQFDSADDFYEKFAKVKRNEKFGVIDMKGTLIVPTLYDDIKAHADHAFAVKQDEKWGLLKADGSLMAAVAYDDIFLHEGEPFLVKLNEKWGFLDRNGKESIAPQFDAADGYWRNGMTVVTMQDKKGIIDENGQWIFKPEYEALALGTLDYASAKRDGKWRVIDRQGNGIAGTETDDSSYEWTRYEATTTDGLRATARNNEQSPQCFFADGRFLFGETCEAAETKAVLLDLLQKRGYGWAVPLVARGVSLDDLGTLLLGLLLGVCPALTTFIWVRKQLPFAVVLRPSWLVRNVFTIMMGCCGFYLLFVATTFAEVASRDATLYQYDQFLMSAPLSGDVDGNEWAMFAGFSLAFALLFSIPGGIWRLVRWWRARRVAQQIAAT